MAQLRRSSEQAQAKRAQLEKEAQALKAQVQAQKQREQELHVSTKVSNQWSKDHRNSTIRQRAERWGIAGSEAVDREFCPSPFFIHFPSLFCFVHAAHGPVLQGEDWHS